MECIDSALYTTAVNECIFAYQNLFFVKKLEGGTVFCQMGNAPEGELEYIPKKALVERAL